MKFLLSAKPFSVNKTVLPALLAGALLFSGCDLATNQLKLDREGNRDFQDYRDALAPRNADKAVDDEDIPSLQSYVAEPSEDLKPMPLVSISVNQTIPLRDALFELAKEADFDLELDSNITGSIIYTARNKPLDEVIGRICEIAGLRYKIDGDTIRVEEDEPYLKNYKLDYLNYVREVSSSVSNTIGVVSGGGASTGSSFSTSGTSSSNFWEELNAGLTQILGITASNTLRSSVTPQITSITPPSAPVQPVAAGTGGQAPTAVLQVSSLPTTDGGAGGGGAGGAGGAGGGAAAGGTTTNLSINRQAGLISVFTTERNHKAVKRYLDELRRSVTAQVLIEAKVLEIALDEDYASGVDWASFFSPDSDVSVGASFPRGALFDSTSSPTDNFNFALTTGDFSLAIEALSRYGTVRALSSPRLTVLNNQAAVLNVATNLVYFELDIEVTTTADAGTQTSVDSEIQNVPEGVLINVVPSIDLDRRTVSMAIRPTITNVDEFVNDPGVALSIAFGSAGLSESLVNTLSNVTSPVPVVDVQEFDSVIEMPSGQAVVLGGLMRDRVRTAETGIPVLAEVPYVGNLFKSHTDKVEKTELVVFLKATIVDSADKTIHNTDRDLYKTFSGDRRPFDL